MPRKRPAPKAAPEPAEQLLSPWRLQVGDIVLDDGQPLEIVSRPVSASNGKITRAVVLQEKPAVRREMVWDSWRKVRVVRPAKG